MRAWLGLAGLMVLGCSQAPPPAPVTLTGGPLKGDWILQGVTREDYQCLSMDGKGRFVRSGMKLRTVGTYTVDGGKIRFFSNVPSPWVHSAKQLGKEGMASIRWVTGDYLQLTGPRGKESFSRLRARGSENGSSQSDY